MLLGFVGAAVCLYFLVSRSSPVPLPRGVALFGLIMAPLHFWGGVHLFRGHRLGLVVIAVLLVLSPSAARMGLSAGWFGQGVRTEDFENGGIPFLLLFCIARLGGWGPKPK